MSGNKITIVVVSVLALAFLALLGFGLTRQGSTANPGGLVDGRAAPDFTLTLFSGEQVTLSSLRGKPVVINFWASWCPPCREEAPVLEAAWQAYKDKGVLFLGVDIKDKRNDALAFIKEFDITYPNGPDSGDRIAMQYGITGVPETYFVNRQGIVVSRWLGAISTKLLSSRIEQILQ